MAVVIRTVNFQEIAHALQNPADPASLLIATALFVPNLFLQWYRWHLLLRLINPAVPRSESVVSLLGGMVAGFVTPGRIGEVGRTLFLQKEDRLQALGLVVIDKLYAFFPVVVGGIWGLFLLLSYLFHYAAFIVYPLGLIASLLSLLALLIVFHPFWIRTFFYNLSILMPAKEKIQRVIHCMDRFETRQARIQLALSILLYGVYIVQFCLFALAFQPIPWTTALTATTATIFVKTLLPISFGDLGIREGASVFFFLKFNVEKATAFNSSLLLFAVNVLLPTLIGLIFVPKMGLKVPSVSSRRS